MLVSKKKLRFYVIHPKSSFVNQMMAVKQFRTTTKPTSRSKRIAISLTLFLFLDIAVVGVWLQNSRTKYQSDFDHFTTMKTIELNRRQQLAEAAEAARLQAEFEAGLAEEDSSARLEREKWIASIEIATNIFEGQRYHFTSTKTGSFSHPAGYTKPISDSKPPTGDTNFWSMRRFRNIETPVARKDDRWSQNPIDRFVLRDLKKAGLEPNPQADQQTLARRINFDVTGLPLAHLQEEYWSSDPDDSYAAYVDSTLNRSEFGEHAARAWLDLAMYADSNGYEEDEIREDAYTYRDFVIWAMNIDLPFDQFAKWQIAGDELAPENPMAVAATGFMTAAPYNTFFPQESERMDELDSMVSTYSTAMLGLSVGCARCHDHFYDPISTSEYYSLVSIFAETKRDHSYLVPDQGKAYREFFDPIDVRQEEIKKIQFRRLKEDRIAELDYFTDAEKDILRKPIDPNDLEQDRLISLCERCLLLTEHHLDDDIEPLPADKARFDQLHAEIKKLEQRLPDCPPKGLTLTGSEYSSTAILHGGDLRHKDEGEQVGPGFIAAVTPGVEVWSDNQWVKWAPDASQPSPRSALAVWTMDVENGAGALAARVIVNRIWQQYFGSGLVGTPGDFGIEGDLPTHPDLLEWLAIELVQNGWSLKHIHWLILNSATYRQDSSVSAEKLRLDPNNHLLSRFVPRRISAEMLRDSILAVSGNLNTQMYGPAVMPPIPRDAVYNTQSEAEDTWPINYDIDRESLWRRGVYVLVKRTVPVPMLRLFDAPDGSFACQKRKSATLPTQALALLNSPFLLTHSSALAKRVAAQTDDTDEQIELLVKWTFGRQATQEEMALFGDYLKPKSAKIGNDVPNSNLQTLCQVLFMSNEFFYIN
ncbi:MAG: DUF1549 and DUF1553 domain-containing protein [Mariniblastus sp.]|nr:DUF1549 and DUF1553 domain-containing protein [Mariniblastus sp.]